MRRYFGPYKIVKQLSPVTYEVVPEPPCQGRRPSKPDLVHVVRLKPYVPPSSVAVEDDGFSEEAAL